MVVTAPFSWIGRVSLAKDEFCSIIQSASSMMTVSNDEIFCMESCPGISFSLDVLEAKNHLASFMNPATNRLLIGSPSATKNKAEKGD